MKKLLWIVALVVVVFACGEPAGQMLVDGGQMIMDAGNVLQDGAVPDAGAQQSVTCSKTHTVTREDGSRTEHRYAVLTVNTPRNAIVERCYSSSVNPYLPPNVRCFSEQLVYFDGNDIYVSCGSRVFDPEGQLASESADPTSITVYE